MTNRERAEKIVNEAWDRAPHLHLETVLVASITSALDEAEARGRESPGEPSIEEIGRQGEEAAVLRGDSYSNGFYAGVQWLQQWRKSR